MEKWSAGGLILDFYDDIYLETPTRDKDLLEKIGSMEVLTLDQINDLPDESFGLVILASPKRLRKYPIYDEMSTELSKSYFEKNAHKLTTHMRKIAATHILRACNLYGIGGLDELTKIAGGEQYHSNVANPDTPDFDDYKQDKSEWAPYAVAYLPNDKFALVKEADDKTYRMYPVDTPQHLQAGMTHFEACHESLVPLDRVKIANAMVRKAEEYAVPVSSPAVETYASTTPNPNFDLYINMRKEALADTESIEALDAIIEKRAGFKGQAFGRALELFDKAAGLDSMWDVAFPDPYATCFSVGNEIVDAFGTEKVAAELDWLMELAQDEEKLASVFGDSSVESFQENPVAVYNSLPVPTRQLLRSLANEG